MTGITLHLTPEARWQGEKKEDLYRPETFTDEGFVHCTDDEDVLLEVANRYYRYDPRPYVVLDVDLARVSRPVLYEDEARQFPHIYGPIEQEAICRVRRMERAVDGTFLAIGSDAD